jgi:hypothetical protein
MTIETTEKLANLAEWYSENRNTLVAFEDCQDVTNGTLNQSLDLATQVKGVNPVRLQRYPRLMLLLQEALTKRHSISSMIESLSMSAYPLFTYGTSDVATFLSQLTDDILLQRFLSMMESIEECHICFDEVANTFFQCAHRVCRACSEQLSNCPYCREEILTRLENLKRHNEKEAVDKSEEPPTPILPTFSLVENGEDYVKERLAGLVRRTSSLDGSTKAELALLIEAFPESDILDKWESRHLLVTSEEMNCYLAGTLYKKNPLCSERLVRVLNSPNRVVRFLSVLNGNEPTKDEDALVVLPNKLRKFIIKCMCTWDEENAVREMRGRLGLWKLLLKHLHIHTLKPDLPKRIATRIHKKQKCEPNWVAKFENLYKSQNIEDLKELFLSDPGYSFRFLRCFLAEHHSQMETSAWEQFFDKLFASWKAPRIIEMLNIMNQGRMKTGTTSSVFRIKSGLFKDVSDRAVSEIPEEMRKLCRKHLEQSLCNHRLPYHLVIESDHSQSPLLLRGKPPVVPSWVPSVTSCGDRYQLPKNTELVLFIHWVQGTVRVDLDLSVIMETTNGETEKVDYTQLKDEHSTICHSGDIREAPAPKGASEYVVFNLDKVAQHYKRLSFLVYSFNAIPFDNLETAIVGLGTKDEQGKGLGPFGCHVLSACQLRGNCESNLLGMADLERGELHFINSNIVSPNYTSYSVQSTSKSVNHTVECYLEWLSRCAPPSYLQVANELIGTVDKVTKKDAEGDLLFVKGCDESPLAFKERCHPGIGAVDSQSQDNTDEEKDTTPMVYFGSSPADLTPNSIIVSKSDPQVHIQGATWISDPYALFQQ